MNKAQRAVLFLAVIAILAMCAVPPCSGYSNATPQWISIWHMYWHGTEHIAISLLLTEITITCIITTLLVLAMKSPPRA